MSDLSRKEVGKCIAEDTMMRFVYTNELRHDGIYVYEDQINSLLATATQLMEFFSSED